MNGNVTLAAKIAQKTRKEIYDAMKRLKSGRWRVSLRATGAGKAVVAVRCRRTRRGQVRTVFTRRTVLPRSIVRRVRCGAGRPRGLLFTGNGA